MKTVLYNTQTQEVTHHKPEGYYMVDGAQPAPLPNVVELVVINTPAPVFNPATHKISSAFVIDVPNLEYRLEYTLTPLTALELAVNDWQHLEFAQRLIINEEVIFSTDGNPFYAYYRLNGNPMQKVGNKVHVWINEVQQQHQTLFNYMQTAGLLILENRPAIITA